MEESKRLQVVMRQIYEKTRGKAYRDLRRLTRPRAMQKRLHMIDVRLQQLASGESRRERLRLENERLLLRTKYELYTNSPNLPMASRGAGRKFLRLTDRHPEDDDESKSEARRNRKAHTIVLMHYAYIDYTYEELVALRDRDQ